MVRHTIRGEPRYFAATPEVRFYTQLPHSLDGRQPLEEPIPRDTAIGTNFHNIVIPRPLYEECEEGPAYDLIRDGGLYQFDSDASMREIRSRFGLPQVVSPTAPNPLEEHAHSRSRY